MKAGRQDGGAAGHLQVGDGPAESLPLPHVLPGLLEDELRRGHARYPDKQALLHTPVELRAWPPVAPPPPLPGAAHSSGSGSLCWVPLTER